MRRIRIQWFWLDQVPVETLEVAVGLRPLRVAPPGEIRSHPATIELWQSPTGVRWRLDDVEGSADIDPPVLEEWSARLEVVPDSLREALVAAMRRHVWGFNYALGSIFTLCVLLAAAGMVVGSTPPAHAEEPADPDTGILVTIQRPLAPAVFPSKAHPTKDEDRKKKVESRGASSREDASKPQVSVEDAEESMGTGSARSGHGATSSAHILNAGSTGADATGSGGETMGPGGGKHGGRGAAGRGDPGFSSGTSTRDGDEGAGEDVGDQKPEDPVERSARAEACTALRRSFQTGAVVADGRSLDRAPLLHACRTAALRPAADLSWAVLRDSLARTQ